MKYELLGIKNIYHVEPNPDGRFFIKIIATDDKHYQIKFDSTALKSNINELISNYIGKTMKAPVLDGVLIQFTDHQMKEFLKIMSIKFPKHCPDMSLIKRKIMFGVEWQNSVVYLQKESELEPLLKQSKNKDGFYALYAYDQ